MMVTPRGSPRSVRPSRRERSADAGQLLPDEHVDDALRADQRVDRDHAAVVVDDAADRPRRRRPRGANAWRRARRPRRRGGRWRRTSPRWRRGAGRGRASRRRRARDPGTGMAASSISIPTPDAEAISLSADARPPRVGSRSTWTSGQARRTAATRPVQRLAVGLDVGLELQPLADGHDRDAVKPDRAGEDHDVAGRRPVGGRGHALRDEPDPRRVHEEPVGGATPHDLRVARDDRDSGTFRGARPRTRSRAPDRRTAAPPR